MLVSKKSNERPSTTILITQACFPANSSCHMNYFLVCRTSRSPSQGKEARRCLAGEAGPGRRHAVGPGQRHVGSMA